MTTPASFAISHYRGDTLTILVRLWHDDEHTDPANIGADTIVRAQVRAKAPDIDPALAEFQIDAPVGDNEVTMMLLPADQATLPKSTVWDLQIDWNGDAETQVQTPLAGTLVLTDDVTRPP